MQEGACESHAKAETHHKPPTGGSSGAINSRTIDQEQDCEQLAGVDYTVVLGFGEEETRDEGEPGIDKLLAMLVFRKWPAAQEVGVDLFRDGGLTRMADCHEPRWRNPREH